MHEVTELTKFEELHRQVVLVCPQVPKSALARQGRAQSVAIRQHIQ